MILTEMADDCLIGTSIDTTLPRATQGMQYKDFSVAVPIITGYTLIGFTGIVENAAGAVLGTQNNASNTNLRIIYYIITTSSASELAVSIYPIYKRN